MKVRPLQSSGFRYDNLHPYTSGSTATCKFLDLTPDCSSDWTFKDFQQSYGLGYGDNVATFCEFQRNDATFFARDRANCSFAGIALKECGLFQTVDASNNITNMMKCDFLPEVGVEVQA